MWVNAQRDGCHAEYRWRPFFNAANVADAHYQSAVQYNAAKTRNPLTLAGLLQTRQQIAAASGPKFPILLGHVQEILLFNNFFPGCRRMPYLRRYGPTKLCDGAQMALLCNFGVMYFQRAACSTLQICIVNSHYKATSCVQVW